MVDKPKLDSPPTLAINYIKSGEYREHNCDGVVGGLTSRRKIWMGFFSERYPLPQVVTNTLHPGPSEGSWVLDESEKPVSVITRDGVVRVVETSAYLDLETAVKVRDWLSQRIEQLEEVLGSDESGE